MSYVAIGDLAHQFLLRQHSMQLKANLARLSGEVASGQVSDVAAAVSGDFTPLAGIERSLSNLEAFKTTASEAGLFINAVQDSLGLLQDTSNTLAQTLLTAGSAGSPTIIASSAIDAREKFGAVVSALNTRIGDRSLLSGTASDNPALASSDVMLADLQTAVAGQTTAAGIKSVLDTWFDSPGGGFDTVAYKGSATPLAPFQIGADQQVKMEVRASDPAVRGALKGFAMSALIANGVLSGNTTEQGQLLRLAGEALLTAQRGTSDLRAEIGSVQAHVEAISVHNQAERSTLSLARSEILSVDPYQTATELQAAQTGLETLYALTARVSRLSLVNFLR